MLRRHLPGAEGRRAQPWSQGALPRPSTSNGHAWKPLPSRRSPGSASARGEMAAAGARAASGAGR